MAAAVLTAALMLPPTPFIQVDVEPPCAPGLIHTWGVLCVTPEEFNVLWGLVPPPTTNSAPIAHELVGEPLARHLVERYFPAWAVEAAMRVIYCETQPKWDPNSLNPYSGASGLFQHMPRYWASRSSAAGWPGADIFDPEANVAVAAWLWGQTRTWQHWSCKP